jgi:hypothetical protein
MANLLNSVIVRCALGLSGRFWGSADLELVNDTGLLCLCAWPAVMLFGCRNKVVRGLTLQIFDFTATYFSCSLKCEILLHIYA